MQRFIIYSLTAGLAILLLNLPCSAGGGTLGRPVPAPAFTHRSPADWVNSKPLTWEALRGKVVLVDFWAFECWNCYRSFPWLRDLETRLGPEGLRVIGVHTPEFEAEKIKANVLAKVKEFKLHNPIMLDNDYSYWNAMGNRFWPAWYIIDRHGRIHAVFYGETHRGDRQARQIEQTIRSLLQRSRSRGRDVNLENLYPDPYESAGLLRH